MWLHVRAKTWSRNWSKKNQGQQDPIHRTVAGLVVSGETFGQLSEGEKIDEAFVPRLETDGLCRIHVRDQVEILKRMIPQAHLSRVQ